MAKQKISLRPLHDRVIVLVDKAEETSEGGIIIPDVAKEKPARGVVMASGKGLKDLPNETLVGDIVLFGKYAGEDVEHDGVTYRFMREGDILAIDSPEKKSPAKSKS